MPDLADMDSGPFLYAAYSLLRRVMSFPRYTITRDMNKDMSQRQVGHLKSRVI